MTWWTIHQSCSNTRNSTLFMVSYGQEAKKKHTICILKHTAWAAIVNILVVKKEGPKTSPWYPRWPMMPWKPHVILGWTSPDPMVVAFDSFRELKPKPVPHPFFQKATSDLEVVSGMCNSGQHDNVKFEIWGLQYPVWQVKATRSKDLEAGYIYSHGERAPLAPERHHP